MTGLTSNPTIFRAAVLGEERYARAHRRARVTGHPRRSTRRSRSRTSRPPPTCWRPTATSASRWRPRSRDDADATVAAARDLWARVDRANAMIKIPATPAGVDAIRRVTADGINVNVTLLFGLDAHAAVMDAYVAGLAERLRRGLPVDHIASVASFFVSRVDTAVDRLLAARGRADLAGRAAVANARLAYARADELFGGERFAALREAGARPQRLLWASTGTKDPRYSDVKYVEELAGPGVVNTMPPATLAAFRDHGRVADVLTGSAPAARAVLDELVAAGVDLDAVTARLLDEGVAAFAASMRDLLAGLAPAHAEA